MLAVKEANEYVSRLSRTAHVSRRTHPVSIRAHASTSTLTRCVFPDETLQRSCRSWSSGFHWPGLKLKKDTAARASRRDTSYRLVGPSCRSRRSPGAAQSTDPNDFLATVQHFLDSQLYLCVREQGSLLEQPQQSVTTDYYDGVN